MSAPENAPASPTRRRILGWSAAGTIGGVATYLGWPRGGNGTSAPAPTAASGSSSRPASAPDQPAGTENPIPSDLTALPGREEFLTLLKSDFTLDNGLACTLVEVGAARKQVARTATFTSFSLLFTAPPETVVEDRIHRVSHAKLGPLDLFLTPVGKPTKDHAYLEAVFSQRV